MATYVLIHGAASDAWYWHLVAPLLRARGHHVIAPDLGSDDDSAGLNEYADIVLDAIGERTDLIVVAHSLGGFTAPLVCARVRVDLLVLVAAMVPRAGESAGHWWANTGYPRAKREHDERSGRAPDAEYDSMITFFHDVAPEVVAEAIVRGEPGQSDTPFMKPWPLSGWPDVPTRFLLCSEDRFFPPDFLRRVAQDRLGIAAEAIASGHLAALAHPNELVERLEAYRAELVHAPS